MLVGGAVVVDMVRAVGLGERTRLGVGGLETWTGFWGITWFGIGFGLVDIRRAVVVKRQRVDVERRRGARMEKSQRG